MPSAIVTVRELKNKETGIDISIPVHKEIKGILQSTWEFYVVVVSNLPYFKSPKHKETDVVQFMVPKKFSDFESLHAKLTEKYPATILPNLPKKQLITTENVIKERKLSLERFIQFLATTNKLVNSFVFLEFLGVNAIKAGKFRKELADPDDTPANEKNPESEVKEDELERPTDLFDEVDDGDERDLFGSEDATNEILVGDEDDNFQSELREDADTKIFEAPDLRGGIDEDDEDLFVPGSNIPAIITKRSMVEEEDNDDLFNIDDDLERFEIKGAEKEKKGDEEHIHNTSSVDEETVAFEKPKVPAKPSLPQKPSLLQRPSVPQKPVVLNHAKEVSKSSDKEAENPKPALRPKPPIARKPLPTGQPEVTKSESKEVQELETDDIMKYIVDNTENDDDVDLFS